MTYPLPTVAIAYDFDGTLAPGNMQERDFIPALGLTNEAFWAECAAKAQAQNGDPILAYMHLMLKKARAQDLSIRKHDIAAYGKNIVFFDGVLEWFKRINAYGLALGLHVEHYIISSGIREMIEGTDIGGAFHKIFASSFYYDEDDIAESPALAVNYTTKTQFLFRINKGCLDVWDTTTVNQYKPENERPVPFRNIIYIGDGETDVPCFRLVKHEGGHAIAVHARDSAKGKALAHELMRDGRVNFTADADYRDGRRLDTVVKGILDHLATQQALIELGKK